MQQFTPLQYLQIDIANNFGQNNDKKDWNVRLEWFEQNKHQLEELLPKAEEPALYHAAVQSYRDVMAGRPTGYPISLDATASGMQILSAITGDIHAASICNVVSTGHREDAYTSVYERMVEQLGESAKIDRSQTKDAIMTSIYGSEAQPKEIFGTGILYTLFQKTMGVMAPAVWAMNQGFLVIWNPNALSNDWVLPDNFHVHVKVMNQVKEVVQFLNQPFDTFYRANMPMEKGRSLSANTTHSIDGMVVREMVRRCNYNPYTVRRVQQLIYREWDIPSEIEIDEDVEMCQILWGHYERTGYLSARILDYINENTIHLVDRMVLNELVQSLPSKPFQLLTVHDCFRCLPTYGNDLRKQYNIQMASLAKSNILADLLTQITGRPFTIGKLDPDLWKLALDAEYSLS